MEDSLYLNILRTAKQAGIGEKAELERCFANFSLEADSLSNAVWQENGRQKAISMFLSRMQQNGHINSPQILIVRKKIANIEKWDNYEFSITAGLSPEGFKYLQEVDLNNSIAKVNISTLENNRFQKRTQIINIVFAAITTVFVVITGYIAITDNSDEKTLTISNEIRKLRESIISKNIPIENDSIKRLKSKKILKKENK